VVLVFALSFLESSLAIIALVALTLELVLDLNRGMGSFGCSFTRSPSMIMDTITFMYIRTIIVFFPVDFDPFLHIFSGIMELVVDFDPFLYLWSAVVFFVVSPAMLLYLRTFGVFFPTSFVMLLYLRTAIVVSVPLFQPFLHIGTTTILLVTFLYLRTMAIVSGFLIATDLALASPPASAILAPVFLHGIVLLPTRTGTPLLCHIAHTLVLLCHLLLTIFHKLSSICTLDDIHHPFNSLING
jgi:hypothetical protein